MTLTSAQLRERYGSRAIWYHQPSPATAGLSAADLASIVKSQGYDTIYIKAGNGGYASPESGSVRWPRQWNMSFMQPFLDGGIRVCAWVYIYAGGADSDGESWLGPEAEADMLPYIRSVYQCPIIIDAEYESINRQQAMQVFADRVRGHGLARDDLSHAPDLRIAFDSGWPRTHRDVVPGGGGFPWKPLNDLCGAVLPQVYFHMFDLELALGSFDLIDAWKRGFPDAPPVLPIFDQGARLGEAVQEADQRGFPSVSVWAFDPRQSPLPRDSTPAPFVAAGASTPFSMRPDLDESGPPAGYGSKPRHFQIIDEGVAQWHDSAEQFRANTWADCGPIAMAHVVNAIRWRQNNAQTMNAGDAIRESSVGLPENVVLKTVDPANPGYIVRRGTRSYVAGDQTHDMLGLGAVAKLLTGCDVVVRSKIVEVPGPALEFDEALELARSRPIAVNRPGHLYPPGHISTVVADKRGRSILWLMQGRVGGGFDGDGGALTASNWGEWNFRCWYPSIPLWGAEAREEEDMTMIEELQARNAVLEAVVADKDARLNELVIRSGFVAGDLANTTVAVGEKLKAAVADLAASRSAASKTAKSAVEHIVDGDLMPIVTAMRGVQPPP